MTFEFQYLSNEAFCFFKQENYTFIFNKILFLKIWNIVALQCCGGFMFKFFDGDHFKNNFIYLFRFLAVLGLCCCTRYSLAVVCRCAGLLLCSTGSRMLRLP